MDIRSWLVPKKTPKRKIEDDDDDVIPESPDIQIKTKKKKPGNDSQTHGKTKNQSGKESKPALEEVKATDLFGNGPIKRTEPIVKKEAKKTETGIHSDDEFEKSLLEIDNLDEIESNIVQKCEDNEKPKTHSKVGKEDSLSHKSELKDNKDKTDKTKNKSVEKAKEKSSTKSKTDIPSPSEEAKHSKKVNEIKKEIRETNKRKFNEFIDDDDDNDLNKRKKSRDDTRVSKNDEDVTDNHDETINDTLLEESVHDGMKKKKRNTSLNESVLTDEERHERKMHSAALYQKYLNRSGPKHLGSKQMPEGAPNCLKDYAFLLTGVLDSFERDEIVETINKYGGCLKSGISKKVTHVLAGEDAGPAKMAKAQELGINIINEDDFMKIIADSKKSATKSESKDVKKEKHHESHKELKKDSKKSSKNKDKHLVNGSDATDNRTKSKVKDLEHKTDESERKHKKPENKGKDSECKQKDSDKKVKESINTIKIEKLDKKRDKSQEKRSMDSKNKLDVKDRNGEKSESPTKVNDVVNIEKKEASQTTVESKSGSSSDSNSIRSMTSNIGKDMSGTMWVEKYKPQNVKQIIGQQGDASNVVKLINWLTKWYVNRKAKLPKPSPWAKNDDGGYYKAALLSGPPGVGKTTTVALVCKQLGFDAVEFNASDTRNKTLIKEQIGELLTTTSLSAYAKGDTGKQAVTKKHVLVMDEVDGMAGNEDRGGLQELIGLIKSSSVPIICMCNDRNSQKMRSLVNYCYDLRFNRPKVEQIKAAMRSICCKENIKIPPDVLGQLIVSANQDVRQTLNLLSLWAVDPSRMDPDRLSKDASIAKKDVKLGPWDAIRKVFSAEEHKTMSINDRSDLFFYDYSLAPLFVQENYLQVQPHCPKHEVLQRISNAADSISFSDTIEARIRRSQAWSLLPMQAMHSSVLPGHYLSGHVAGQIQFPGWLGKNSRANKLHRLCQEIHAHTRLSTTGSKSSIFLDYSSHLRDAIITPLIKDKSEGIEKSLAVLEAYHLLRDDLDSLAELSLWPAQRNPTVLVDSKVKAAMTRTYNKQASALPYAPAAVRRGRPRDDEDVGEEDDTEVEADSDPENDALIKKKNSKGSEKQSNDKPSTSKAKSSGKGIGKGKKK